MPLERQLQEFWRGVAQNFSGVLPETVFSGEIGIFIRPDFKIAIVDGLITNFHLPKSTLLVLISAFLGHSEVMNAYEEAIKLRYRFYSFGDAMFIA